MYLLLASLAVATAIGILVRLRDGRFHGVRDEADHPLAPFAEGRRATFVQFSSEICSVCPRSLEVLRDVAGDRDGVDVVELHAEEHMDLVHHLDIRRSPTVFLLDEDGAVHSRTSGAMNNDLAGAALTELLERGTHVRS